MECGGIGKRGSVCGGEVCEKGGRKRGLGETHQHATACGGEFRRCIDFHRTQAGRCSLDLQWRIHDMSGDFNFVGGTYIAASITQNDQECINWYPEQDPTKAEGERGVIALYPTPGLILRVQLANAQVRGMHVIPSGSLCLIVSGATFYSVTQAYVATSRGTLNSSTGRVYITNNGVSAYITDGTNRYTYNWTTNAFATVAATDGPFTGGSVCDVVDNFIIYNKTNTNQFGCTNVGDIISNTLNLGSILGSSGN